jgi:hypothetical protein
MHINRADHALDEEEAGWGGGLWEERPLQYGMRPAVQYVLYVVRFVVYYTLFVL